MNVKWTPINLDYKYIPKCIKEYNFNDFIIKTYDCEKTVNQCNNCKFYNSEIPKGKRLYTNFCPFFGTGAFITFRYSDYVNSINIFRILRLKYYAEFLSVNEVHIPSFLHDEKHPRRDFNYYLNLHDDFDFIQNSTTFFKDEHNKIYLITHLFDVEKDKQEKLYKWAEKYYLRITEFLTQQEYVGHDNATIYIISAK